METFNNRKADRQYRSALYRFYFPAIGADPALQCLDLYVTKPHEIAVVLQYDPALGILGKVRH
jgi:hypothetical protein